MILCNIFSPEIYPSFLNSITKYEYSDVVLEAYETGLPLKSCYGSFVPGLYPQIMFKDGTLIIISTTQEYNKKSNRQY